MATTVCLSFDFDAISLWIKTFKQTSPTPISRGEYGAHVGVKRVLEVLEANRLPATFFVPGQTADLYSDAVKLIAKQGHEIAAHGYLHESPAGLTQQEESTLLDQAEGAIKKIIGAKPVGYRSPSWDLSPNTIGLLQDRGYLYDSSMMADDFTPYRPRFGDQISPDGSVVWGGQSSLVEFPVAWELDDFPYFAHVPPQLRPSVPHAEEVFKLWMAEFDYCRSSVLDGVFTLTMHPQIIGRGPRISMLDRLIKAMKKNSDVKFTTMRAAAEEWIL